MEPQLKEAGVVFKVKPLERSRFAYPANYLFLEIFLKKINVIVKDILEEEEMTLDWNFK